MARFARKTVILAKLQTTVATDPTPTGAANAMLVRNINAIQLNANNVDRALIRAYFGGSEQLVGTCYKEVSFDVELAGSGAAGTAPNWGPLLQACGYAEGIEADTRVDYTPITDSLKSICIYYYDDGVLHVLLDAKGDFTLKAGVGELPVFTFRFIGADTSVTAAANASPTYTGFQVPNVVTTANTGLLTLGATHATAGAPALTSGTTVTSQGIEISGGNALNFNALLGEEAADISDRAVKGKVTLDQAAAAEVTRYGIVKAATLSSVGLVHGTDDGNKVLLFMPTAQFINPTPAELNGRRLQAYDLSIVPSAGNDELRICCF